MVGSELDAWKIDGVTHILGQLSETKVKRSSTGVPSESRLTNQDHDLALDPIDD